MGYSSGTNKKISKFETNTDTPFLTHTGMSSVNLLIEDNNDYFVISSKLNDTLCLGCSYKISFFIYVTNGSNMIYNNIGLLFNLPREMWNSQWPDKKEISKYYLKSKTKLVQGKWQKFEFEYIARGDEYWFTIGKYYTKNKVKPLKKKQSEYAMLIYIDDVSITKINNDKSEIQN